MHGSVRRSRTATKQALLAMKPSGNAQVCKVVPHRKLRSFVKRWPRLRNEKCWLSSAHLTQHLALTLDHLGVQFEKPTAFNPASPLPDFNTQVLICDCRKVKDEPGPGTFLMSVGLVASEIIYNVRLNKPPLMQSTRKRLSLKPLFVLQGWELQEQLQSLRQCSFLISATEEVSASKRRFISLCAAGDWIHMAKDNKDPSKFGYRKIPCEQEDALRDALNERLTQEPTDEDDETQRELQKKRFLEQFPELKRKLEEHIRKLQDLADHIDKVHKDVTISNVVSGSTSTASGVLGILGLVLAPFTGGGSLMLTATSLGLGAAAALAHTTTTIVEESHRVSHEAEVNQLVKASMDTLCNIIGTIPKISVKLYNAGSISNLLGIMGIPKDGLQNLANTLEGDKDLNSPRELSPEAEKELALVEKTIREAHVDRVNPELKCILVILPSRHSPTGILMQREDVILEWLFLPRKPNKKLKTYIEKISDLIHKGKLRLRQLTGMDPAEIVVPLTNEEVSSLWKDNEYWQRACSDFLGEINNHYPKSKRIEFIKKTEWVLPHIVQQKPISGVLTFYTDANKLGKAGYKSGDLSKVVQSPYNSVQKAELYAILMVLMDFTEPLNIVTDSQYAERVVLHIETAEFIPDNTELTSLFIQLQEIIRNREHPIYITHIRSHTGLPGPLAQGNDEIDQLLIGNVLEASEFHKKHHVNSKGLKKDFAITWQQAKDIVKKCPTCSFYNQTPLPAGSNPKGIQRNEIWQMDVFHFMEFGRLKYVHHTIDTYSGFQWATPMSSEKADSVITHLLEVMAIMGIPVQIKTDNAPAYVSNKMRQFFVYYNIRHVTVLRRRFIEEVAEYLQDSTSRKDLQLLLAKDEAWKALVAEAELSRDEEAALSKALKLLLELPALEDKEQLQRELQDRKRFREDFPDLKRKLEAIIRKLRALADHLDQVHRGCTISNVVTNSTSTVSGVLGILGLALAPVTAGGSLLLSATGLGLGTVATVTGAVTVVVEETSNWSDEAEAKRLMSETMDIMKTVLVLGKIAFKISKSSYGVYKNLKTLGQHIRAIRAVRANPHLVADAKLLMTGGIRAQRASQVQNVFEGTALAMTKKARIRGVAVSGAFLALDVYFLVKDSMHLYDGAKSDLAEKLRALAQELEEKLREFDKIHKTL
ncbi:hypothetical protein STEG23_004786 [Scotinomys teguina]